MLHEGIKLLQGIIDKICSTVLTIPVWVRAGFNGFKMEVKKKFPSNNLPMGME